MTAFGSGKYGGYSEISDAYKKDPSIEQYVRLRREAPNAELEVSVVGGLEQLFFMEEELNKYGFEPRLVASVLDANKEAISELSLQIMEKMIIAKSRAKLGETQLSSRGLVVPEKLIDWLVAVMLDSLSWNDSLFIPRDLIVLIRERLGGSNPAYEKAADIHEKRRNAIWIGATLHARGVKVSMRYLAKMLEVSPSTVSRWFPDGDFEAEIQKTSLLFDENGELKSWNELPKRR